MAIRAICFYDASSEMNFARLKLLFELWSISGIPYMIRQVLVDAQLGHDIFDISDTI
jgi:hypothetical protein